jgi:hypothetical protein
MPNHWLQATAGHLFCYIPHALDPPPVISVVSRKTHAH